MRHVLRKLIGVGVLVAATTSLVPGSVTSADPPETAPPHTMALRGNARLDGLPAPAGTKPARTVSNGITYHKGPVMTAGVNTYIIWYGAWADSPGTKQGIITNLLQSIGGSSYYNINTTYYDGSLVHVPNTVKLVGSVADSGSAGTSNLSDAQIQQIVVNNLPSLTPAPDVNSLIFVLTSSEVTKSGFLTQYCGWHTHGSISGIDIKYSFVGDPTGPNLSNCAAQTTSPNGDAGADAMASVIAHELEETATDPDLNAWYDSRGYENADKCAWTFGTTSTASNGSKYNVTLGGSQYLIQRNWLNASGGLCTMSY